MKLNNILNGKTSRSVVIREIKTGDRIEDVFRGFSSAPHCSMLLNGTSQDFAGYSYFGCDPFMILKSKGNSISLKIGEKEYSLKGSPFDVLKKIMRAYEVKDCPEGLEFVSGGIGYFSYDLCHFTETLPARAIDDLKLPDCYVVFYKLIYIYDRISRKSWVASVDFLEKDSRAAAGNALKNIRAFKELLKNNAFKRKNEKRRLSKKAPGLKSNFSKQEYLKAIKKSISYIYAGDIYQVNLSQRFNTGYEKHPYELFMNLSRINPAPFSSYLNFGDFHVVSSSPERFLKIKDGLVSTRPMKGTRPRGGNKKEDGSFSRDLLASAKDAAELSMIVDLERNDLGKTCEFGSVRVENHKELEIYSTVFQLTSTVTGRLKKQHDCIDVLKSCFPGGSITGCPKIRAMEIIDELEPTRRSVYTGSIGYLGFNKTMDLNIVIRTILLKDSRAYFQVGGGIVADSVPENEYLETLDKAKALVMALK